MIPPGRISDQVIVYSGCTTRSLKFQMPPLLLISRCYYLKSFFTILTNCNEWLKKKFECAMPYKDQTK